MQLLFSLIAITSIWCLMIKIVTSEGMVLERLGKYGEKKVDEGYKIFEALWVCQWCMPSIHSLVGLGFAWGMGLIPELSWHLLFYYPLVAGGSSLVNGLVWQYYLTKNNEKDFLETARETAEIAGDWIDADLLEMEQIKHEQTNN